MRLQKFTERKAQAVLALFETALEAYKVFLGKEHELAKLSGLRHRTLINGNISEWCSAENIVEFCKRIASFTDVMTGPELSGLDIGRSNGRRPSMGITYPYKPTGEFQSRDAHLHAEEIGLGLLTEAALATDAVYLPGSDLRAVLSATYMAQLIQKEMVEQQKDRAHRMKYPFLFTPATRRGRLPKVILVGKAYWEPYMATIHRMLEMDAILPEDLDIFIVVDTLDEAAEALLDRKREWRATFNRNKRKRNKAVEPAELEDFFNSEVVPAYEAYIAEFQKFAKKSGLAFRMALFGGHRLKPESPYYQAVYSACLRMAKFVDVITGAGPGAMLAANNGAHDCGNAVRWGIGLDFADQRIEGDITILLTTVCFGIRLDVFATLLSFSVCGLGGIGTLLEALFLGALAEQERKSKLQGMKRTRPVLKNPLAEIGLLPTNYFVGWVWEPLQAFITNIVHAGSLTRQDAGFFRWCHEFPYAEKEALRLRRRYLRTLSENGHKSKN
jgi:predicted Rossmann-fold nucleotide-binding protein